MEHAKLVDLVLNELMNTRQPAVSVRRVFKKHKVDYTDDLIKEIESTLNSKSLIKGRSKDSADYTCYAITETGTDFVRGYGSYSKYLRGLESEKKKVARAKKKKPYVANRNPSGEAPAPYSPPEKTFMQRNGLGLILLLFFIALFYIVAKISS